MAILDNYNEPGIRNEAEGRQDPGYRLEPLNYGELVDRTIRLFRENFSYLLPTTFSIYIPYIFSTILFFIIKITTHLDLEQLRLLENLNSIISSMCTFVLIARVTTMVTEIYNGNPVDANTIKIKSSGFYWQIFKTGAYYGLSVAALVFLMIIVSAFSFALLGGMLKAVGFIIAVIIFALMLLMVFRWAFSHSLSVYLVPLEGISGGDALNRSKQLFYSSKESMYKVILIPLIIQVLLLLLFVAPTVIPMVILMAIGPQYMQDAMSYMIYINFLVVILGIFLNALPIIAMSVVYYDIKIRTEGFDIEREMDHKAVM